MKTELKYTKSGDGAEGAAAHEKFVKTTNTAMLSGKGPDLIEMDQLPIESYVKKDLLANMSEIIENDPTFITSPSHLSYIRVLHWLERKIHFSHLKWI